MGTIESRLNMRAASAEAARQSMMAAARELIRENGTDGLTHAAIARRTGFSKSNVLYHFATKNDLWHALIDDYVDHLDAEFSRSLEPFLREGIPRDRAILPSMVLWYRRFSGDEAGWPIVGALLMTLRREDPGLTEPIRSWYRKLYADIARSGLDPVRARGVMLMFDGLFNAGKLGVNIFTAEEADALMTSAIDWTYPDGAERRGIDRILKREAESH